MSRHAKKRKKKGLSLWARVVLIALILLAALLVGIAVLGEKSDGSAEDSGSGEKKNSSIEESSSTESSSSEKVPGIAFPYELGEGGLAVDSLFQFTGFNPDCGNQEGENVAGLTVRNQSERHLTSASLEAEMEDGSVFHFEIADLPPGASVMVFEKDNQSYELDNVCVNLEGDAEFEDSQPLLADSLTIDVQETAVTLTNRSGGDLNDLVLHCHCLMDEEYFGGLTYTYPIESIPAGQSVTVQAEDCYLGQAAPVRVSQGSQGE